MTSRRDFLAGISILGLSSQISCQKTNLNISQDQDHWAYIYSQFLRKDPNLLNLNNGSSSNMPLPILDKYISLTQEINSYAPYQVLNSWEDQIKSYKQKLSELIGAEEGALNYTLNTTYALNSIISGFPFESDDEIICNTDDYPYPIHTFENLSNSKGITIKKLKFDFRKLTNEEVVQKYKDGITSKTKLIHLTHITHCNGHIYPIKEICAMAKEHGIDTLVDGAHAVGHIDINLKELGCDYFASSLHKWFNAPHGTGMLYVKNDKIEKIQPLQSFPQKLVSSEKKFTYVGTRPFQNELIIGACLDFLGLTGIHEKQKRFKSMQKYWMDKIKDHPNIILTTDEERSCNVGSFFLMNISATPVKHILKDEFNIHTKVSRDLILKESVIRISPDLNVNFKDLDRLIDATVAIAER